MKLCALSVDLDDLPQYLRIHGLPAEAVGDAAHLVYDLAIERVRAFGREVGSFLSLFAIGADLARERSADALAAASRAGHPVENHSLSHDYAFSRGAPGAVRAEIRGGADAIARVTGRAPVIFRAPGYVVCDRVFDALEAEGVAFDSSAFPCPPYQLSKALVWWSLRALGRPSASVLDVPRASLAPRQPWRVGAPWWRPGSRAVIELPVAVTPGPRLPLIGTSLGLAGALGARALARACARDALVNLELHGIDFLDARDAPAVLGPLAKVQPELRVPVEKRLGAVRAAIDELARAGHTVASLTEAAAEFAGLGSRSSRSTS